MDKCVDVVFITYLSSENRVKLFAQTFESFIKNTNFDLVSSVVLVDDCSPIKIEIEVPQITYVKNEKQSGVGFSKNLGASQGNAKYIYFGDTDTYFTPRWLEKILDSYEECKDTFKLIGGGVHPYLQPREGEQFHALGKLITSHDAISGWSWLLERETWNKYGPLDSHAIGSGQSEDWALCRKIVEDGYKVGAINPPIIFHCGITNVEGKPVGGAELFTRLPGILYL